MYEICKGIKIFYILNLIIKIFMYCMFGFIIIFQEICSSILSLYIVHLFLLSNYCLCERSHSQHCIKRLSDYRGKKFFRSPQKLYPGQNCRHACRSTVKKIKELQPTIIVILRSQRGWFGELWKMGRGTNSRGSVSRPSLLFQILLKFVGCIFF